VEKTTAVEHEPSDQPKKRKAADADENEDEDPGAPGLSPDPYSLLPN